MNRLYNPENLELTKYLFFTGKGGVGKTSTACSTAVQLADAGKRVFLVSTDPASNLQDVFETELDNKGIEIKEIPNLVVANLNPEEAAAEYRNSVIDPYRGKLPESVIENLEEQLSGSCTVEIASFNEFANLITDNNINTKFDYIIFDTAPTGHTLRMLQLPSAWDSFLEESTHGASCLGQLSGLGEKKEMYSHAVKTLSDPKLTTLVLVSRPEKYPLLEAARASRELAELGVKKQKLIINGVLEEKNPDDKISISLYNKQQTAIEEIPDELLEIETFILPLRSYNISGIENIRKMFEQDNTKIPEIFYEKKDFPKITSLVQDLFAKKKKVIFTMGKGGVGKTTVAISIAKKLAELGENVHLTTTDPAGHLTNSYFENNNIEVSNINEQEELEKYKREVISKAIESGVSQEDLDYIEEDLRSPCTQEIAVFRAFAEIVEKAEKQTVIIDTAPTGHTLLLLNSTESYHKEMQKSSAEIPESVKKLLPKLKNKDETEVVIVTLPEATPYFEAYRLKEDLNRAGIANKWWVINSSLASTNTIDPFLIARATNEIKWINNIKRESKDNYVVIPWHI